MRARRLLTVGASQRAQSSAFAALDAADAPGGTPEPASTEAAAGDRRSIRAILGVVFFIACIGMRFAWLRYDPPSWLSWSSGVYTDEGFYTLDARHRALFGTLAPGDFHDSYMSPFLSWIQLGWFKLVGVGLIQARLLDVVFGLATLALYWDMLRRRVNLGVANVASLMLGLSPIYLFYNCLALQETPALFWIVLGLWLVTMAERSVSPLRNRPVADSQVSGPMGPNPEGIGLALTTAILAGVCVIAALACKSIALIFVVFAYDAVRPGDLRLGRAFIFTALGFGVLYAICCWYPHRDEIARMSAYYATSQIAPHSWTQAWLDVRRAVVDTRRGVLFYLVEIMPITVVLAAIGIGEAWRRREAALPWLAAGILLTAFSNYAPSRYYVLFLPALCWLAGIGWCGLRQSRRRLALAASVLVSFAWIGNAWAHRASTVLAANASMARLAGHGVVVAGEFAPEIGLNSDAATAPVQPGLSNSESPVESLKPSYVVIRHAPFWDRWWNEQYPGFGRRWPVVAHFDLGPHREYSVDVYRVVEPANHAH